MIKMTLTQAARVLDAAAPSHDATFTGVSIDSRTTQAGNLFVAILGENLDGHAFIQDAAAKGAVAAIVSKPVDTDLPLIIVEDTTLALGKLAAAWRQHFDIPFIAVTGSNGKTTLKNMIASILTAACAGDSSQVLATKGTLNNHWGLPLTLLQLNDQHRYAAIEMGMNHFGEIAYLTDLVHPDVAVITNAAASHLEGVGSVAGVARAKAEIFQGLTVSGMGILNRDDQYYDYWCEQLGEHPHLSFGFHPEADVSASWRESGNIMLKTPQGETAINLPLLGQHNVCNMLAATAAALAVGIDMKAIKAGIENIQAAPGRLQVHRLPGEIQVIDDSYNANPFSLQAAVETLAKLGGRKILVLGDMKELGAEEKALHFQAGENIRHAGIDHLFTCGSLSAEAATAFGKGAEHFQDHSALVQALKPLMVEKTTILVKGSRSMRMEKVVSAIIE